MQCDGCGLGIRSGYTQNEEQTIIYCLQCRHIANQDRFQFQKNSMAMMNALSNQIEGVFGLPPSNKYQPPPETYVVNGATNNHFDLQNSVVGTINTGVVETLNTSLNNVSINDATLAQSIKEIAEKTAGSTNLSKEEKEEALEALTFLSDEAEKDSINRNKSMIKAAGKTIRAVISLASDLVTLSPLLISVLKVVYPT